VCGDISSQNALFTDLEAVRTRVAELERDLNCAKLRNAELEENDRDRIRLSSDREMLNEALALKQVECNRLRDALTYYGSSDTWFEFMLEWAQSDKCTLDSGSVIVDPVEGLSVTCPGQRARAALEET
jgi:hypothetical protein